MGECASQSRIQAARINDETPNKHGEHKKWEKVVWIKIRICVCVWSIRSMKCALTQHQMCRTNNVNRYYWDRSRGQRMNESHLSLAHGSTLKWNWWLHDWKSCVSGTRKIHRRKSVKCVAVVVKNGCCTREWVDWCQADDGGLSIYLGWRHISSNFTKRDRHSSWQRLLLRGKNSSFFAMHRLASDRRLAIIAIILNLIAARWAQTALFRLQNLPNCAQCKWQTVSARRSTAFSNTNQIKLLCNSRTGPHKATAACVWSGTWSKFNLSISFAFAFGEEKLCASRIST